MARQPTEASRATLAIPAKEPDGMPDPEYVYRRPKPRTAAPATIPADAITDAPEPPAPKRMGRPSIYTQDLGNRILEELRLGRTPTEVAAEDWAPHVAQIYRWMDASPDFREAVARARALGAAVMADRAIDIADKADETSKAGVQKARLQVDARFRLASVYDRRFSDRQIVTHEHDGAGQVADMSTKELGTIAQQLAKLLTQATAIDVDSEPVEKPSSNKAITDKAKE